MAFNCCASMARIPATPPSPPRRPLETVIVQPLPARSGGLARPLKRTYSRTSLDFYRR